MTDVHIIGVGLHRFGRTPESSGLSQGVAAARAALADADLDWRQIQFAFGGSTAAGSADALLPYLGLSGIPFVNVANGCATGGSALLSAVHAIRSGEHELGLVVGFDAHPQGAFNFDPSLFGLPAWYGETGFMLTTQFFAMKIRRYMALHGISPHTLALVAEKAFANGARTPHAWRRKEIGSAAILAAPMVSDPLTKYMFCSPGEGAAALVVASGRKLRALGASGPRLRAVTLRTRGPGAFEVFSPSIASMQPPTPTEAAAQAAFAMAGVAPGDIHLAQIQDTDSGAELMHMAEIGFCGHGDQEQWLAERCTALGGPLPVNTDGGCMACGEPIAASGLRQVVENVLQLQGRAERRQVEAPRLALSQVYGMPGLAAVTVLEA